MGGGDGTAWAIFHLYHHRHNVGHAGSDVGDDFEDAILILDENILEYALPPARHKNQSQKSGSLAIM